MGNGFSGSFDASQFSPNQGGGAHPVGKFPFSISHTECVQTKDQQGGMFVVTLTSPVGEIKTRYNLWNSSTKAVEIAHGQLSALCHATGVFKLDWHNEGAALRGARGMMEVGYQKGEEPSAEKPQGGYVEVKKVYDVNGNEPGKAPAQPQQTAAAQSQPWPNPAQAGAPANGGGAGWQPGPNAAPQAAANPTPWPGPVAPQGAAPPWSR